MSLERNCRIVVVGILLFLWVSSLGEGAWGDGASAPAPDPLVVPYFAVPDQMELCGERVPLHLPDVRERLDREFTIVVYSHAQVYLWLKRMERFFPWIEKELARKQLPADLKYVAVAESDLILSAASSAGALGPWQFIRGTGSNYGLNQTGQIDERMDFELATESALRYLRNLNQFFSNWTLAIAAYNCGEGRVKEAMGRQKSDSYYSLRLPLETERYVFRILAIKEVLGHPERYGYSMPKSAGYPPILADRVNVRLQNPVPVVAMAEAAGVTYRDFKNLNPAIISDSVPEGSLTLKVPEGKGKEFEARVEAIKAQYKPHVVYHKVVKGETLGGIAARYGVSEQSLVEWNRIKGKSVHPKQMIKIIK